MSYTIIGQSGPEPINLSDLKMHLRVDGTLEDSMLETYLSASRSHCERFTGLSFVAQQVRLVVRKNEADINIPKHSLGWHDSRLHPSFTSADASKTRIILPLSPVTTIDSVKDQDGDNVDYKSDLFSIPASISIDQMPDVLIVEYTTNPNALTADMKLALLMLSHLMYQHRGDVPNESVERVEEAFLRKHRVLMGMA